MTFNASAHTGTRARWFRLSVASFITLVLLSGMLVLAGGCSDGDGGEINFPEPEPEVDRNWVFDVFGTAADNIYAVGNKGAVFRYDGTDWNYMDIGVTTPITNIWGPADGSNTLYAVGHAGKAWRINGGEWTSLETGTEKDLYAIGQFQDDIYASGGEGTLRRLSGSSLVDVPGDIVIRNPENDAPEDTLALDEDIYSLVTINFNFIGGAYALPDYEEEIFGLQGTGGMILAEDYLDEGFDWILRPIGSDQFAISEWILATTSDPVNIAHNYMGTSEGWIYRLYENGENSYDWLLMLPDTTVDSGAGIRDMWTDADGNLFAVTDSGTLIAQTADFDFLNDLGARSITDISHGGLSGIWGTSADNLFITGFNEDVLIQASVNMTDLTVTFAEVPLAFPNKSGGSIPVGQDHQGLPLR